MKIELTSDQLEPLLKKEREKLVNELSEKFNKDLVKVQAQLQEALQVIEGLLTQESAPARRKYTDQEFLDMINQGMSNAQISKATGYNASYISMKKKKLLNS